MKHKPIRCPCARASERASESESEKRREKERERALLEANVHNGRPLRGPLTEERWSARETERERERERESVCVCVCVVLASQRADAQGGVGTKQTGTGAVREWYVHTRDRGVYVRIPLTDPGPKREETEEEKVYSKLTQ